MSDVLSSEEVEGFVRRVEARYIDFDAFAALARSHEQLRGERDAAVEREQQYHNLWHDETDRAEAAARAGGCAADALRPFADFPPITTAQRNRGYISSRIDPAWIDAARDALSAYDRAVSGQTAEKEEA